MSMIYVTSHHLRPDRPLPQTVLTLTVLATLIIAGVTGVAAQSSTRDAQLKARLGSIIASSGAETVGVAFYDLENDREILINPDTNFHAASTMKVPVMMEVFRQAKEGKLSLDGKIPVTNAFKSIADGSTFSISKDDDSEKGLYDKIGQTETVRELVNLMINVSSNLATNILIDRVNPERVMELMRKTGAKNIRVRRGVEDSKAFELGLNNTTTARDLMIILRSIADGRAVSNDASRQMVDIMVGQKFNEGIPAGLPPAACVAHKTGSITRINHDAGIVYTPGPKGRKPYILVVLTRGIAEEKVAHQLIAQISRAVYEDLGF